MMLTYAYFELIVLVLGKWFQLAVVLIFMWIIIIIFAINEFIS